jgi:hypothetical protein
MPFNYILLADNPPSNAPLHYKVYTAGYRIVDVTSSSYQEIFAERFATTEYLLIIPHNALVTLHSQQVIGFTSNDTKQQNIIAGLKTPCTRLCPCATCIL